mmetsp:Transcript_85970/g.277684  ORF Transcript_85970/g.277684 Transcript_85970/m.277684 type:complete len:320 (-) Transcript_85970:135-1094(-)
MGACACKDAAEACGIRDVLRDSDQDGSGAIVVVADFDLSAVVGSFSSALPMLLASPTRGPRPTAAGAEKVLLATHRGLQADLHKEPDATSEVSIEHPRSARVRGTVHFLESLLAEATEGGGHSCGVAAGGESLQRTSGSEDILSTSDSPVHSAGIAASSESEPEVEPSGQAVDRPDFSGPWLCTRIEGDWDAYLKDTGVSWAARLAISSMGFGVGKQIQHIEQLEDRIRIVNIVKCCPPREATCTYRTDGVQEDIVDLEGKPTLSTTFWRGSTLVTKQVVGSPQQKLPTAVREMHGEEMCTERVTKSGIVVRRFYCRPE